jgi:hypothetical protein
VLNFPSANATWVFTDDGGWRKQQTWNIGSHSYDVWHARNHVLAFGKHLVGDRFTGTRLRAEFVVRVRLRRRAAAARAADAGPVSAGSSASSTRACGSISTTGSGS